MPGDSASYAAEVLAQRVSPPTGGMRFAASNPASGGVSLKVTSVCQLSLSGRNPSWLSISMISGSSGSTG